MSDVYLIEVNGRAAGLVARDEAGRGYRFHAAVPKAFGLDGRVYLTPDDAQKAVRKALAGNAKGNERPLNHAA